MRTKAPYIVELKIKQRNRDNSEWETLCQRCWNINEDIDIDHISVIALDAAQSIKGNIEYAEVRILLALSRRQNA